MIRAWASSPLDTASLPSAVDGKASVEQHAAATLPSQELIRQQAREDILRQQQELVPDVHLDKARSASKAEHLPLDEKPCFVIHRIQIIGDTAENFPWLLDAANQLDDRAEGRCLGSQGVNLVMRRMQNELIARGFITTRILAAPQDMSHGVLQLTLMPGRIHEVRFTADSSPRATLWNALPAKPGDILNLRDIEQALENFKRIPTVEADIQISPSTGKDAHPGDSDLLISWKQNNPFRINLSVDDAGSKATGRLQGSATLSYDDWWTLNDLFYISFNHDLDGKSRQTRGTEGYTAHYELPYGHWLLGWTASHYRYAQAVAGRHQTYLYSGNGESQEIKLSRMLYRDAIHKLGGYLRGWTRASHNYIDDTEVQVQRRRMAGWEAGLTHKEFMGDATLDASFAWRQGTGAMSALPAPEENGGTGTSRPVIRTADAQLNLPFRLGNTRWQFSSTWRAQWNGTPLVPQDRFSIGSRYTVRGFDGENVLSAERGWLIRNDLSLNLGQSGQALYAGLDYGEVDGPSAEILAGKRLAGGVVGLRGNLKNLSYDLFIGQPYKKPKYFQTANTTAGFNLNWSLP
jgi:hemolysin activation/secretion protein